VWTWLGPTDWEKKKITGRDNKDGRSREGQNRWGGEASYSGKRGKTRSSKKTEWRRKGERGAKGKNPESPDEGKQRLTSLSAS